MIKKTLLSLAIITSLSNAHLAAFTPESITANLPDLIEATQVAIGALNTARLFFSSHPGGVPVHAIKSNHWYAQPLVTPKPLYGGTSSVTDWKAWFTYSALEIISLYTVRYLDARYEIGDTIESHIPQVAENVIAQLPHSVQKVVRKLPAALIKLAVLMGIRNYVSTPAAMFVRS